MKLRLLLAAIICILITAGCSQSENAPQQSTDNQTANTSANSPANNNQEPEPVQVEDSFTDDPITLTLYNRGAGLNTDQDLQDLFITPVQKQYPNISIEYLKGISLDEMVVSGELPDLIVTSNYYLRELIDYGLTSDMNDFVKARNVDFSKFEQEALRVMDQFSENGELHGIPYSMNYGVLLYNQDIFDMFGIDYPTDGMYWEEVIDLAKQVTRNHEGVQYIGLDIGGVQVISRHRSLMSVDPDSKEPLVDTDAMRNVFELYKSAYDIPGAVTDDGRYNYGMNFFMQDQRLAMFPYWIAATQSRVPTMEDTGINWDMVSFPQSRENPGFGREVDFHLAIVPPKRGEQELQAIYRVLETVITEEAQEEMNKGSRLTIFADPEMRNTYSSAANTFDGKNLEGIYSVKPILAPVATKYDGAIYGVLNRAARRVVVEGVDINTALREAQEEAVQIVQEIDGTK